MEYIRDHGSYADLQLNRLLKALATTYPGLVERASAVDDPTFTATPAT
jgi:hypothetical protein